MKNSSFRFFVMALLFGIGRGMAQNNACHSVLSEHSWHRIPVAQEGVYRLDYATLSAMGIDMERLDPRQIRMFGNPSGALPEKNSEPRPDDLTEMALYVEGADDGVFDADDYVLFYGQEATRWKLAPNSGKVYERERNYYSDTTYYYLCVDSGVDGLRIGSQASLPLEGATTVITEFPDFVWHEEELFSPYNLGRNLFGEVLTSQDSLLSLDFCFPNLVKSKPVYVKTRLMGRARQNDLHYDLWANDNLLVSYGNIKTIDKTQYVYGLSATNDRQILSESDTIRFGLKLYPDDTGPILYLDYVELFGWRRLKREGSFFPFRLADSQFGAEVSAVWVQNVSSTCQLWEVSTPLQPVVQEGILSAGNFVYALNYPAERRYVMFEPSEAMPVASWVALPNQDLHAISDADMLVITNAMFRQQADALARFHADEDGLLSVVVDVEEIYNEFSTGTTDPSGIRDFIRMVYLRNGGQLKYVTLFGRPSFDFRDLNGYNRNFVPCYEEGDSEKLYGPTGTDDFFGLMDANEGLRSAGAVDIGIGRLPVSTPAEAEAVLQKIYRYHDLSKTHGDWKLSHLLLSDDEKGSYITANEIYAGILDTICPDLNPNKVYCGAYPHVNTSSGVCIPQANADLMAALDKGVLMMSYSGHGGVKGLTGDNVFTVSDINAMQNGDKMPFVFTATCEFSKYEDPLLLSAGEQMFLLPNGGAIAMLTTTRPTGGSNNEKIGRALMNVVCRKDDDGHPLRFGDIVRRTKSHQSNFASTNGISLNINFVLFGDPALRLALPEENIVVLKINGKDPDSEGIELHAMSMVAIEGEVRITVGDTDAQFDGELSVTLFDRKTKVKVPYDDGEKTVYFHKDILYQGRVSVRSGRFSLSFQLPKDISLEAGTPRFAFYACDSIRGIDAMGVYDNIVLEGTDPSMMPDDEGPQISFYWNSPDFQNGDVAERQGTLYADLYDAQGIYHYDFSLGRDMVLNSNVPAYNNLILNERYEPSLNDFRRGRLAIPVAGLEAGTYEFDLKVWDMQSNSSTAHVWFVVNGDVFLASVHSFPNPFSAETHIVMTHVGKGGNLRADMQLFDVMGRNVATISEDFVVAEEDQMELVWNGCDHFGHPLPEGVYLYRLTLTDEEGYSRTVSQRLMIAR